MACSEYIYSEDYITYMIDYNYDADELFNRYKSDCVTILSDRYALLSVAISERANNKNGIDEIKVNEYGYKSFPKLYTIVDDVTIENIGLDRLKRIEGYDLSGNGILIGFIDTGINYNLEEFIREDGVSKIVSIWDQTAFENEELSYAGYGRVYNRDEFIEIPQIDTVGHGTSLAAITQVIAPNSELVVVKLKEAKNSIKSYYGVESGVVCYEENDILAGIFYLEDVAREQNKPLVICMSVGCNSGGHTGKSYIGEVLDFLSDSIGLACVVAGGNELNAKHHYRGQIKIDSSENMDEIELNVGQGVDGFSFEIWTQAPNIIGIGFVSPTGEIIPMINYNNNNSEELFFLFDTTKVYIEYINNVEGIGNAVVIVRFKTPLAGLWKIQVYKKGRVNGRYDMWLPIRGLINGKLEIVNSSPDTTLVEPSNTLNSITVAGYNGLNNSIYVNSSRGYTFDERIKPDIVAPAVEISTINGRGDETKVTGTSYSAAVTAGVVALLYEWADSVILFRRKVQYEIVNPYEI